MDGEKNTRLTYLGIISISRRSLELLWGRWRNESEEGILEKLIIPPAFRSNFQQPLAPPIESASVRITTHKAIKGHPALSYPKSPRMVAPGIAEDEAYEDGQNGRYGVRRGDL